MQRLSFKRDVNSWSALLLPGLCNICRFFRFHEMELLYVELRVLHEAQIGSFCCSGAHLVRGVQSNNLVCLNHVPRQLHVGVACDLPELLRHDVEEPSHQSFLHVCSPRPFLARFHDVEAVGNNVWFDVLESGVTQSFPQAAFVSKATIPKQVNMELQRLRSTPRLGADFNASGVMLVLESAAERVRRELLEWIEQLLRKLLDNWMFDNLVDGRLSYWTPRLVLPPGVHVNEKTRSGRELFLIYRVVVWQWPAQVFLEPQ